MTTTQLASYDYYMNTYNGSKIKDLAAFNTCCMEASRKIGQRTLQQVFSQEYIEMPCVKDCACAIAELIYLDNMIVQSALQHDGKEVSSEKVGEYSVNYNLSADSRFSKDKLTKEINQIMVEYLAITNLLYRGAYVC